MMFKLSIGEAEAIQSRQINDYGARLSPEQRMVFFRLVSELKASRPAPRSGFEVPRGGEIERLYFLAMGRSKEDHAAYCRSMD